jgi:hypothetical protein
MVLWSPGTIARPVAPGTFGLLAGLVTHAPGPATILDDAEVDSDTDGPGVSEHPTKPKTIPNAVKVVAILFIPVFPFDRHHKLHPGGHYLFGSHSHHQWLWLSGDI